MRHTKTQRPRCFTIIELVVVIVILGILTAIAAIAYNNYVQNAQKAAIQADATQIGKMLAAQAVQQQRPINSFFYEDIQPLMGDFSRLEDVAAAFYPEMGEGQPLPLTGDTPSAANRQACVIGIVGGQPYALVAELPLEVTGSLTWTEDRAGDCQGTPLSARTGFVQVAASGPVTGPVGNSVAVGSLNPGVALVLGYGQPGFGLYQFSASVWRQAVAVKTLATAFAEAGNKIYLAAGSLPGTQSWSFGAWDGTNWLPESSPCTGDISFLYGGPNGEVFARCASDNSLQRRLSAGNWQNLSTNCSSATTPCPLGPVSIAPNGDVYLIAYVYNGTKYEANPYKLVSGVLQQVGSSSTFAATQLNGIYAAPNGSLFAFGTNGVAGQMWRWSGSTWNSIPVDSRFGPALGTVSGQPAQDSAGSLYFPSSTAFGGNCAVKWDGSNWSGVLPMSSQVTGCQSVMLMADGAGQLFAAGSRLSGQDGGFSSMSIP